MNTSIIEFHNYTAAMKAASVLAGHGIKTVPKKSTSPSEGCIYTLEIHFPDDKALNILRSKNISFIINGGDQL